METFHGDKKIKAKYLKRLKAHAKADEIIQGTGWKNGKGCAVGCTLENYKHKQYEAELGIPEWLAHLEDKIFEGLQKEDAMKFPVQFLSAVPVGIADDAMYKLRCDLDYQRLSILLKEQTKLHPDDDFGVNKALEEVMRLNQEYVDTEHEDWLSARSAAESAARSAAMSAESAEESSAMSAARSARSVRSARSAESSAMSAAWSAAESAAESAAWKGERDRLIKGLKALDK